MALGYKVAIFNVWWRRGEVDTRFFSSKAEQNTYFDSKTLYFNDLNNFNINDNITTVITFRDASGRSIDDLLKCNYAIVKDSNSNYRYFFITAIKQDAGGQVQCTLDLDDIQNNFMGSQANFKTAFVKRYTGNNLQYSIANNEYSYNFTDSLKSYIPLEDSPMLYNKETKDVFIKYTGYDDLDTWLNDNIEYWKYIFIVDNNQLLTAPYSNSQWARKGITSYCYTRNGATSESLPYGAIAIPVFKKNAAKKVIYLRHKSANNDDIYYKLTTGSLDSFITTPRWEQGHQDPSTNYPIGTYGIEIKISNIPPLAFNTYEIDNDGDLIVECYLTTTSPVELVDGIVYGGIPVADAYIYLASGSFTEDQTTKETASFCIVSGYNQKNCTYSCEASIDLSISNPALANIKLFDYNTYTFRLRIANQHYDYNALALYTNQVKTTGKINLLYTDVLKAGVSKMYLRVDSSGEYTEENENDYTGLVASMDLTEALLTNQWADYFASHKNYYMQTMFNNTLGLAQGTLGALGGKNDIQIMSGLGSAGMSYWGSVLNQRFDRENMQASPNNVSNANGEPYFNTNISGIKPKVDILDMADTTKAVIIDKLNKFGHEYNRIVDNMGLNILLNTHKFYEAISFDIYESGLNISEKEFERLKAKLGNLNRFWKDDTTALNLSLINYIPI